MCLNNFIGPAVVTTDEVGDPHNLDLSCQVNESVMQSSNTNQLVFNSAQIVAWVSKFCTLLPGDVILTGTPPGVGVFMKPPKFLKVNYYKTEVINDPLGQPAGSDCRLIL